MFEVDGDKTINITRGDVGVIEISTKGSAGENYTLNVGDIVRLKVVEKNDYGSVVMVKDTVVEDHSDTIDIKLEKKDTKIGSIINKPVTYWYEIELNPDTEPQTIVGHDKKGAKSFILYPEGGDK
jgi:hypothetical protein